MQKLNIVDICVDDGGGMYILDGAVSRVFAFDKAGKYLCSIGTPGGAFDNLSLPMSLSADSQGRILVVDSTGQGLLGYDKTGRFLFALGGFGQREGKFYFPKHVSTDRNGRIYVVEPFLKRIQVLRVEDREAI
jgi:hypothetical protein